MNLKPIPHPEHPNRRLFLKWAALALVLAALSALMLMRRPPPKAAVWTSVARSNLVLRADCWYPLHGTNPFTGWMVDAYPDGSRLSRVGISNGLLNGVCESWFINGQPQSLEHFKNGVSNGWRKKWYDDGRLKSQADIVNGVMEETFRRWYDNGQLAEQIKMKHGQPDGLALAYYPSGFVKAKTLARDGRVINRKLWKDGEYKISKSTARP